MANGNGATIAGAGATRPDMVFMGWLRVPQPDGSILLKPCRTVTVVADEVGTREAAQILGVTANTVRMYCDAGTLVEGKDWRRNPSLPGSGHGGSYRIRREAVMRLRMDG